MKKIVVPSLVARAAEEVFVENPKKKLPSPSGLSLTNLYESELGKDFAKVGLVYLQQSLPQLFVEDLEMADDFEMNVEGNMIQVKITGSVFKDFCSEAIKLSNICGSIGCYLCSSIAIALTRATAKPIIIQENKVSKDGKIVEVYYKIVEE